MVKNGRLVMGYYGAGEAPINHFFATSFTFCDHWFCAVPSGTQANRLMAIHFQQRPRTGGWTTVPVHPMAISCPSASKRATSAADAPLRLRLEHELGSDA